VTVGAGLITCTLAEEELSFGVRSCAGGAGSVGVGGTVGMVAASSHVPGDTACAVTVMVIDCPGASLRGLQITCVDPDKSLVRHRPSVLRTESTRSPCPAKVSFASNGVRTALPLLNTRILDRTRCPTTTVCGVTDFEMPESSSGWVGASTQLVGKSAVAVAARTWPSTVTVQVTAVEAGIPCTANAAATNRRRTCRADPDRRAPD